MITLTRNNLTLSFSEGTIPAQGSSKVPIQFVNDETTYTGYIIQPNVGWFNGLVNKQSICEFENDIIYLPAEAFALSGVINLSIALIDPTDANHIEVTNKAIATVNPAPMGTVILPSQDTWQQAVQAFTQTLFDNYTSETVQPILNDAQQALDTATQQQQQIDSAISQMGKYQIVSEDPVQIQFKQGDGTYGQTVDLGDGLASKSMVNAGYYQSISTQYSGSASDYGIEVSQIQGAYEQDGTPTPTSPIEPQFVEINNFYTSGINLLNSASFTSGYYFDSSGNQIENDVWKISDFQELIKNNGNIYLYNVSGNAPSICFYDSSKNFISGQSYSNQNTFSVQIPLNAKYIRYSILKDYTKSVISESYSNQTLSTPITLRSLPNGVYDTLDSVNVRQITFDGSEDENWTFVSNTGISGVYGYYITVSDIVGNADSSESSDLLCDRYIQTTTSGANGKSGYFRRTGGGSNNKLYFYSEVSSLSEWKTTLQSNPINVWYQLAEPTPQEISIPLLESFYPFTNAWCDSIVQPQITWNVLTGRSSVLDGNGNLLPQVYMTAPPNGLINGDFMINQRGQSSYVGNASEYVLSVDCWCLDRNTGLTVTPNSDGSITLANTSSQALGIYQQLPNLTFPCVAGIKLDGADAQYFLFEGVNTFNVGTNAQIAIVQIGSSYWLKLIVNAGQTITIDYADYWPGEVAYKHIAENVSTALNKCRYFIEAINGVRERAYSVSSNAAYFKVRVLPKSSQPNVEGQPNVFTLNESQQPNTVSLYQTNYSQFADINLIYQCNYAHDCFIKIPLLVVSSEPVPQS